MKKIWLKIFLLIVVATCIILFFVFDLQSSFNLASIQEQRQNIIAYYNDHQLLVVAGFFIIYVLFAALALPAATVLTLLAGTLFGWFLGLLIVSFASSLGATLSFLLARLVAGDSLQNKYSKALAKINAGFAKEGLFYLFALRLVPLFPFFVVNVLMGLMKIKAWNFYWVSQLGMLPGTAVYVYAGTQLAQIESLNDIVSPGLLIALMLLGVFPLLTKKVLSILRRKR